MIWRASSGAGCGLTAAAGRLAVWAGSVLLAALVYLATGCGREVPERAVAADPPNLPRQAQAKLSTLKLWLGAHELVAEVARNERERTAGMMYRTNIAEDEAMLFVFPYASRVAFWMKNVPIPLSCAYIDRDGRIVELHELKPHEETPVPSASGDIQFVLETAQGWFERHSVGVGTLVQTEMGTLRETFLGKPARGGALR